ncbi:EAL domain-containing protein [Paenibacillus sp. HWE-109]|uniref:putative bifunctional diguanylate cyclase/phosphodiesterase n=1 Tax=Paenibacillus sp. HWE-109 TaxID=1306526 RepID=UPI001EDD58E0|nr:EAL domain-containing protein [Paenibacillus sp. HWE-109]UKS27658.1 EAL domain-containing protein [Paenibacillus sp. HWE-109]
MSTRHLILTCIIYLLPSIYFLYSSIEIGLRNPKSKIHRAATLFVANYAVIFLTQFLMNLFPSSYAPFFYQIIFFPSILLSTGLGMMFYFSISKIGDKLSRTVRIVIYVVPFCLFTPLAVFTPYVIKGYEPNSEWIKPVAGPLFPYFLLFVLLYVTTEILMLVRIIRAHSGIHRRKYVILMITSLVTLFWGILVSIFTNLVHISMTLPELSIHPVIFYVLAARAIIKRYDLLPGESRKYEMLFDLVPFGVALLDKDGNIVEINAAGKRMLPPVDDEHSPNAYSFLNTFPEEQQPELLESHRKLFDARHSLHNFEVNKLSIMTNKPMTLVIDTDYLDVGDETLEFMILRDITAQKEAEQKISFLAYHDALTGLPNRNQFQRVVKDLLQQAEKENQLLAVMLLDLDRFKIVNDSLGHQVGDRLLQFVAGLLSEPFYEGSTVARIGGDEFLILLPNLPSKNDGLQIANHLIARFQNAAYTENGIELSVTASMGISFYPNDGKDVHSLIKSADISMYRAKEQGRNQMEAYQPSMSHMADERLALERNLRKAIERDELVLYYQPQIDLTDGRVCGMEALVRWNSPEQGMVPPLQFIPFAEECGLIVPLGDWVLRNACLQCKHWQDQGLPALKVAVNISTLQFHQHHFADKVQAVLEETGLDAKYLCLEITESVAIQNEEQALALLNQLTALGISIAIDDFGTGFSSLSLLHKLPVHQIKIDKSFIGDKSPQGAQIAKSIISLSRSLNMNVLAEGVETEEQYNFLAQHKCDSIQGYLISRPVSANEFEQWHRARLNHISNQIPSFAAQREDLL